MDDNKHITNNNIVFTNKEHKVLEQKMFIKGRLCKEEEHIDIQQYNSPSLRSREGVWAVST